MTESIFNGSVPTEPVTPPVVSTTTTTLPQEVIEFVGAGKKYATVDDALKSVPHAQKHISTLEAELAQAKEELNKRKTTEELLSEIRNQGQSQVTTTTTNDLSPYKIAQIVQQTIEQDKVKATASQNVQKVTSVFTEKFGEKAEEVYISIAKDSGLSINELNSLASRSPSAVLKLAGLTEKQNTVVQKPTGTVNTNSFNNTQNNNELSARVKSGATTKDLVSAWRNAGIKVGRYKEN